MAPDGPAPDGHGWHVWATCAIWPGAAACSLRVDGPRWPLRVDGPRWPTAERKRTAAGRNPPPFPPLQGGRCSYSSHLVEDDKCERAAGSDSSSRQPGHGVHVEHARRPRRPTPASRIAQTRSDVGPGADAAVNGPCLEAAHNRTGYHFCTHHSPLTTRLLWDHWGQTQEWGFWQCAENLSCAAQAQSLCRASQGVCK
jgi:hypothetical protein